ncbi:hypothetical protein [Natribacillus halophilus]|uniref:Uncharacterized protein n=1 Tax=Natribacillus halophilus TaxID=549003 RepID=A0A1G8NIM9_9BACI|nr:hypothetical protein [Natribacillus halophilus]SDI79906.1 hypothetical protein SAMN04488123_10696 [Natribacillus halophilus]
MKEPNDKEIKEAQGEYKKVGKVRPKLKDLSTRTLLIVLLILLLVFLVELLPFE